MNADNKEQKNIIFPSGSMLILVLVATGLFLVLVLGAITVGVLQQKLNLRKIARTQALHIAEAGVNYYRWVLYHEHEEYCNNESCIGPPNYGPYGPYAYTDSAGKGITGYYELYITPPELYGSTIVKIRSVGWVSYYPNIKREVEVKCGIPSWSNYSTLCDSNIRFGEGTETWGPIHSNGGIRFDGVAHNVITSQLLDYDDPDHAGPDEYGVHTHVYAVGTYDPNEVSDGSNPPTPPDYSGDANNPFLAGRSFPVTPISFNLLDNYSTTTRAKAAENGIIIPHTSGEGYHITITPVSGIQNDILTIKVVNSITSTCYSNWDWQETFGITNETNYMTTTTPPNGLIYVEDNLWVDGQLDGDRITMLAFYDNNTNVIINNDITYTHYDGTEALGLVAENNVSVGLYSEDNLRIDAALIAKNGRVGRNNYNWWNCDSTYWDRDTITVYGAIATKKRYGFAWTDGSGYDNRNLIYDSNLMFAPPPHYPTTGEYTFISWREK
jgi:hypothetical protein